MYHVPANKKAAESLPAELGKPYLYYCFIGLWMFNLPYFLLVQHPSLIFDLFLFYQWRYFAPVFFVSMLANKIILKRANKQHYVPVTSYRRMLLWGLVSGGMCIVFVWYINKSVQAPFLDGWWYRLSLITSLLSGQFALGGLLSVEQRSIPEIEVRGSIFFTLAALMCLVLVKLFDV